MTHNKRCMLALALAASLALSGCGRTTDWRLSLQKANPAGQTAGTPQAEASGTPENGSAAQRPLLETGMPAVAAPQTQTP